MTEEMTYVSKPWLEHYDEHVPETSEYPADLLDWKIVDRQAQEHPEAVALIYQGATITYSRFAELNRRVATGLAEEGVQKGDIVATLLPTCPAWYFSYFGAQMIGATTAALSPIWAAEEIARGLNQCGAETIIALDRFWPLLEKIKDKTPLKHVFLSNPTEFMPSVIGFLGRLTKAKPVKAPPGEAKPFMGLVKHPPEPPQREINPEDTVVLYWTGGTTGIPKCAELTHRGIVTNATQNALWNQAFFKPGETVFMTMYPVFHSGGNAASHMPFMHGSALVCIPNPRDLDTMLSSFSKYEVEVFVGVPAIYTNMLRHEKFPETDFSRLEICVSGSAALPPELLREWEQKTGSKLVDVYGITEGGPVCIFNPWGQPKEERRTGSLGLPITDVMARVVDIERGKEELSVGEAGELIVAGPHLFKGYLNQPDETDYALREFDGEHYLYTGDICRMEADGFFYMVDRKKDMISTHGGFHVAGREVDDVLYEHPAVSMAATVGVPDPDPSHAGSEIIKAFVVLKPGHDAEPDLAERLREHCRDKLAPYKVPKEIEFRAELPLTGVGKPLKRALREETHEPVE
jgi:long-chain acyl-CoA synthetase